MPVPSKTNWSALKKELINSDAKELIKLVGDLYRLSEENRLFLHTRHTPDDDQLDHYKKVIYGAIVDAIETGNPRYAEAKKAISLYAKAVDNPTGETELQIYYVECGNKVALKYGDIDERFYDAMVHMYDNACTTVLESFEPEDASPFMKRLQTIYAETDMLGWGYHDGLVGTYYNHFHD